MRRSNLPAAGAGHSDHGMKPRDFAIGMEFWMSRFRWRCTNIGSLIVVAIKLEHDDDST
jgi:hypothetical protein